MRRRPDLPLLSIGLCQSGSVLMQVDDNQPSRVSPEEAERIARDILELARAARQVRAGMPLQLAVESAARANAERAAYPLNPPTRRVLS